MNNQQIDVIQARLSRIESRLVQLMFHMGIDPTKEKLFKPRQIEYKPRTTEGVVL